MKAWSGIVINEPAQTELAFHKHQVAQIFCIQSGFMRLQTRRSSWMVSPGKLIFIPSNIEHSATIVRSVNAWSAYLPAKIILPQTQGVSVVDSSQLLESLLSRVADKAALGRTRADEAIKTLIVDELRNAKVGLPGLVFPTTEKIFQIAESIRWREGGMTSVVAWAKKIGMSERNFSRQFKEETGVSFEQWRLLALMQKATELLIEGSSVSDVAFDLGYSSPSSFIASFKKHFGLSPKNYMRER